MEGTTEMMMDEILQTDLGDVPLMTRGKVRDVYDLDDKFLIVATDRISAYDVVSNSESTTAKPSLSTKSCLPTRHGSWISDSTRLAGHRTASTSSLSAIT